MKKTKLSRVLFTLAITATVVAASAIIACASDVDRNADYKYSETLKNGAVFAFDQDLFTNKVATGDVLHCKITIPEDASFNTYSGFYGFWIDGGEVSGNNWEFDGQVAYCALPLNDDTYCGTYKLVIDMDFMSGESKTDKFEFYYGLRKPSKVTLMTFPDYVAFNTYYVDAAKSGRQSLVTANGQQYTITNGWGEYDEWKGAGLEPGKKYNFTFQGIGNIDGEQVLGSAYTLKNVPMGPKTTPVIKSVKISGVKVSKYFNYDEWRYKYKTTYTIKVTLSKKASGTKGIYLKIAGTNGLNNAYKTIKGTGKTFTAKVTMDAPKSYKGGKVKVTARTYSSAKYKAYSYESKAKKVTIK